MQSITTREYIQVLQLLHFEGLGYWQNQDGSYFTGGYAASITTEDIEDHLAGRKTFAIPCVLDELARFVAIDIDAHATERVPIISQVIREIGGLSLFEAMMIIGGSDAGRAKVLIAVKSPIPKSLARHVKERIISACEADPDFQGRKGVDLTCWAIRVGGRHRVRGDKPDDIKTLWGSAPEDVRPISESVLRAIFGEPIVPTQSQLLVAKTYTPQFDGTLPAHITELLRVPRERGSTSIVNREIMKLAGFFSTLADGEAPYRAALANIQEHSPAFAKPSLTTKDKRSPYVRELREMRAWKKAQTLSFVPHDATTCEASEDDLRRYQLLCRYALTKFGQSIRCFEMSLREVASVVDFKSAEGARKFSARLERDSLLVIHDAGRSHTRERTGLGKRGLPMMLGLVGIGDLPETVRQVACKTQRFTRRERTKEAPHGTGWAGVHCEGCRFCYVINPCP